MLFSKVNSIWNGFQLKLLQMNTVMFALCKNKNIHCYFMMQWILSSTPVPVTKNSNFCCFAHSSKQQNQLSLKLDGILVWFCILNLQLYDRKPIFQSTYIPLLFFSSLIFSFKYSNKQIKTQYRPIGPDFRLLQKQVKSHYAIFQ